MTFTLADVVPWGRTFDEYCAMFALSEADLAGHILGCGDGPASFNAVASQRGARVISADPLFQFSAAQIRTQIEQTAVTVAEQTHRNAGEFLWNHFRDVEDLVAARMGAMAAFLDDLSAGKAAGRYLAASLPALPFRERAFDLALCSHFLFLYSEQRDLSFHVASILELARAASEVRIFPLQELGAHPSRHLEAVIEAIRTAGLAVSRIPVPYEFQRGANQMLRVRQR